MTNPFDEFDVNPFDEFDNQPTAPQSDNDRRAEEYRQFLRANPGYQTAQPQEVSGLAEFLAQRPELNKKVRSGAEMLSAFSNGATAGFGEDIVSRGVGGVAALKALSQGRDVGAAYESAQGRAESDFRGALTKVRQDKPLVALALEAAPGLLGGGKAAVGAQKALGGVSRAKRLFAGAKSGAAGGAVYGAGNADGGVQDRVTGAAVGGAVGAASAPVFNTAGAGVDKTVRSVRRLLEGRSSSDKARQAVSGAVKRATGRAPEEIGDLFDATQNEALRGRNPIAAEVLGPEAESLLTGAAVRSPRARGQVETTLRDANRDQQERIIRDVSTAFGQAPGGSKPLRAALDRKRKGDNEDAYGFFRREGQERIASTRAPEQPRLPSPTEATGDLRVGAGLPAPVGGYADPGRRAAALEGFLERPAFRAAYQKARTGLANKGDGAAFPEDLAELGPSEYQRIYEELSNVLQAEKDKVLKGAATGTRSAELTSLQDDFRSFADEVFPFFQTARETGRRGRERLDALQLGEDIFKPRNVADDGARFETAMAKLNQDDGQIFAQGAVDGIARRVRSSPDGFGVNQRNAAETLLRPDLRKAIKRAAPERGDDLLDNLATEARLFDNRSRLRPNRGSRTAFASQDAAGNAAGDLLAAGVDAGTSGGAGAAARIGLRKASQWVRQFSDKPDLEMDAEVARLLLGDPDRFLAELSQPAKQTALQKAQVALALEQLQPGLAITTNAALGTANAQ
ncbi:MAG: hypothetical protein AAFX52_11105 [Pseudomonadota bacterium]